jgi:hypothetical protein
MVDGAAGRINHKGRANKNLADYGFALVAARLTRTTGDSQSGKKTVMRQLFQLDHDYGAAPQQLDDESEGVEDLALAYALAVICGEDREGARDHGDVCSHAQKPSVDWKCLKWREIPSTRRCCRT